MKHRKRPPRAPSGTALPIAAYYVTWILFAPHLDCYFKQNCACTVICFESDCGDHIFTLTVRPREPSREIAAPRSTYRNTACATNNIKGSLSTFFADIYCFTWNIAQPEQRGRIRTAIGSKIELFNFEQTSCLSGSSSLHSTSRQRSFASAIMLSTPFQRFSGLKPTRNYILHHKTCFKITQSLSVISYDHFQGNSAGIQIKPSS